MMKLLTPLFLLLALNQGCAPVIFGYVLQPVDFYQARVTTCREFPEIHELSYEEVIDECNDHIGCTKFSKGSRPAQIFFLENHKEVLHHEMDHCIAGGPRHVGDSWNGKLATATFAK